MLHHFSPFLVQVHWTIFTNDDNHFQMARHYLNVLSDKNEQQKNRSNRPQSSVGRFLAVRTVEVVVAAAAATFR